ncbi:GDP-mannose 4,6-dehydratase [Candidatus Omnitrophota bacterium]
MAGRKIFIAGGAGFIGANLIKFLLDRFRFDITVYDNLSTGSRTNLSRAIADSQGKGKVRFIKGDILDYGKLSRNMRGHAAVIHLAAHTRVLESLDNPRDNFTVNAVGTFNVLEAARNSKIKIFVFASSNAAVGEQIPPINEKMVPRPLSPYGASKLYGEALCSSYFHSYGLKTVSLRFANAYGPYSAHKTSVVAKFLKRARAGKRLEIYGDGNQTRDFIHAQDISQAIYLCSFNHQLTTHRLPVKKMNKCPWGQIFQIATGKATRIIDLVEIINETLKALRGVNVKTVFSSARRGEIRRNYSDIKKARIILGFRPGIELEHGIKSLISLT